MIGTKFEAVSLMQGNRVRELKAIWEEEFS
jgi:hypothetical protein